MGIPVLVSCVSSEPERERDDLLGVELVTAHLGNVTALPALSDSLAHLKSDHRR